MSDDIGKWHITSWKDWDNEHIVLLLMALDIKLTQEQFSRLPRSVQQNFELIEPVDRP